MHHYDLLVPHAVCWRSDPALIWTMVVTNAITFLSYAAMWLTLTLLARRTRSVLVRDWAFFLIGFALFILACGSTHLLEVITTWIPVFWIDAATNIVTAVLSAYVAIQFFRCAPAIGTGITDYAARLANTERERLQLESSLLASQKLDEWSRVSASVSHEIASPLESIQNLLYLIQNTPDVPALAVQYAAIAANEAERTAIIARSALDFMRQSTAPRPVDLYELIQSVRLLLDRILHERAILLQVTTTPQDRDTKSSFLVEALAGEARQVLLNLIRNAAEATPTPGTSIAVELTARPADVLLSITDQGSGIAPDLLPNLFQFGRTTKGENGNGMGLWTVQQILRRHGGSIHVDSSPGTGTTFTLTWPRVFAGTLPATNAVAALR